MHALHPLPEQLLLRPETAEDSSAVERVVARAFGPGRFAKTSERVRELARLRLDLSHVALARRTVVGCCRVWSVAIGDAPALFLGPLAVEPAMQEEGLGQALTGAALAACNPEALPVIVVGRPDFFTRFGFVPAAHAPFSLPGPLNRARLMWRPVQAGDAAPTGWLTAPPAAKPA